VRAYLPAEALPPQDVEESVRLTAESRERGAKRARNPTERLQSPSKKRRHLTQPRVVLPDRDLEREIIEKVEAQYRAVGEFRYLLGKQGHVTKKQAKEIGRTINVSERHLRLLVERTIAGASLFTLLGSERDDAS